MKLVGWRTLYRQPRTTIADRTSYKYQYLLKGLIITQKNQVLEIDITYLPMAKGFMYLYAIVDVYSRYIVAWDISNSITAEWCASAPKAAIDTHGIPQIINSDQGAQFTSAVHVELQTYHEIQIGMDGKRRAIDNFFIERFWRNINHENIYLHINENGLDL